MFNISSSEIIFLLLLALIVLGPEKLPEAVRKFGSVYGEFKKMSTGFQNELKSALDEPMREMRETADAFKKAATFDLGTNSTAAPSPSPDAATAEPAAPAAAPEAPPDGSAPPTDQPGDVAGSAPPLAPRDGAQGATAP